MNIKHIKFQKIVKQINKGGITYGPLLDKDYGGTQNIAISPFPERSQILKGRATTKMITSYCNKNSDLLQNYFALGAWFDKSSKRTYLDVAATISLERKEKAVTLGKNANQIAGFNLFDFSEIPLGGTGELNSTLTPFSERLREASMLMSN